MLTQLPAPTPGPPSSLLTTSLQPSLGETRQHIDSNARFLHGEKRFPSPTVQRRANSDSITRTRHLLTYPLLKLKAHYNLWSHLSSCLLPSPHAVFRGLIRLSDLTLQSQGLHPALDPFTPWLVVDGSVSESFFFNFSCTEQGNGFPKPPLLPSYTQLVI